MNMVEERKTRSKGRRQHDLGVNGEDDTSNSVNSSQGQHGDAENKQTRATNRKRNLSNETKGKTEEKKKEEFRGAETDSSKSAKKLKKGIASDNEQVEKAKLVTREPKTQTAKVVFEEDGEQMLMDVNAEYDSEIDGDRQEEDQDEDSSSDESDMEVDANRDRDTESSNRSNNASIAEVDKERSEQELYEEFLRLRKLMEEKGMFPKTARKSPERTHKPRKGDGCTKEIPKEKSPVDDRSERESISTIYTRAVKRGSSSSEDNLVNTSDEMEIGMEAGLVEVDSEINFLIGKNRNEEVQTRDKVTRRENRRQIDDARPGCSYHENPQAARARRFEDEIDERLDREIRQAEGSKARINELKGKTRIESIDDDYSVLGNHLDSSLRKKIVEHEYVDFSRLLPRDKVRSESDNRLEMVNQNGKTYWVPYSDRDNISIGSYHKWDLAFRVFSNVYTSVHPSRATKLLQYQHLIFSASQNYIWDNVYTYDIDFRLHMSKHPERNWGLILHQAWSFRLKDRLTYFKGGDNASPHGQDKGQSSRKRNCNQFNQGYCEYGYRCKFEHRCAICNKYGHGAVNCRRGFTSGGSQSSHHHGGQDRQNDRYHYHAKRDHGRHQKCEGREGGKPS